MTSFQKQVWHQPAPLRRRRTASSSISCLIWAAPGSKPLVMRPRRREPWRRCVLKVPSPSPSPCTSRVGPMARSGQSHCPQCFSTSHDTLFTPHKCVWPDASPWDMKSFLRRIMDQASGTEIASFPIYKVLFCARGQEGSVESDCFSFTESYRSSEDFQIHVFSCHIKEAVSSNVVPSVWKVQFSQYRSIYFVWARYSLHMA